LEEGLVIRADFSFLGQQKGDWE